MKLHLSFIRYKSGRLLRVYVKLTNAKQLSGHATKIIGWGSENKVPHWLLVNSWNLDWGDYGTFKIRRGTNESEIYYSTTAGIPRLLLYY